MELRECYERLGGDFDSVLSHLRTEARVERFLLLFLGDDSYDRLVRSLAEKKADEAFRAAHTLKGICQNLSFTRLHRSSAALTEALRNGQTEDISALVREVGADYAQTVAAIRLLAREKKGGCPT